MKPFFISPSETLIPLLFPVPTGLLHLCYHCGRPLSPRKLRAEQVQGLKARFCKFFLHLPRFLFLNLFGDCHDRLPSAGGLRLVAYIATVVISPSEISIPLLFLVLTDLLHLCYHCGRPLFPRKLRAEQVQGLKARFCKFFLHLPRFLFLNLFGDCHDRLPSAGGLRLVAYIATVVISPLETLIPLLFPVLTDLLHLCYHCGRPLFPSQ